MSEQKIPNYSLYGEFLDKSHPVAIHIEAIADRSPENDWIINPHRHGKLFQILCIFDGTLDVQLDEEFHHLAGNWLVTVPMGVVHSFRFEPHSEGVVISVSEDILSDHTYLQGPDYLQPLFHRSSLIELDHGSRYLNQIKCYIDLLRDEFRQPNSARQSALMLLIKLLLITVKRQFETKAMETFPGESNVRVLDEFRRLVEENYKYHWHVTDYAKKLNVSPSTLNRMCHEKYATNAKSIVQSRLIAEAKRRLIFTRQPLDQIAYYLGYKDPAYFSRVFKNITGEAPGEFRRSHNFDA